MQPTIPESVVEQLRSICQAHGCYLLEARLVGLPGRQRLVLYIDNEEGITHRECAAISDAVLAEFIGDPFGEEFQFLEVSSPGVDRPLSFPWQFRKHIGRHLRCQLADSSVVEGTLCEVTAEGIVLRQRHTTHSIPFAELLTAHVVPRW
ncbi:Ribosome maturation factor RimP [bacterium HR21]|nr:Ribosome maturation factor RimP [bacterium HR21]